MREESSDKLERLGQGRGSIFHPVMVATVYDPTRQRLDCVVQCGEDLLTDGGNLSSLTPRLLWRKLVFCFALRLPL